MSRQGDNYHGDPQCHWDGLVAPQYQQSIIKFSGQCDESVIYTIQRTSEQEQITLSKSGTQDAEMTKFGNQKGSRTVFTIRSMSCGRFKTMQSQS